MRTWQKWVIGIVGVLMLLTGLRQLGVIPDRRNSAPGAPVSSGTPKSSGAPERAVNITSSDLVGRWGAPTERCGYSTTYDADGTFRDHLFDGSVAGSGRWRVEGDQIAITYQDGRSETQRIVEWNGDTHVVLVGAPPVRMNRRRCPPV